MVKLISELSHAMGTGSVKLPPGMTQEEADRLLEESTALSQENNDGDFVRNSNS